MAVITGASIIDRAEIILQDTTNVRWPRTELLTWGNDGQREVVLLKPEACVTHAAVQLTADSTKQSVPATALRLIEVVRNMGAAGTTPGKVTRLVSREVLDAQLPDWHTAAATGAIDHYMFDPRNPKTFFVYPKSPATAWFLDLVCSAAPADMNDSGGVIGVDDVYANALLDYVLYKAYSKDATYAQNAQLALAHYTAFANSLGITVKNDMERNPALAVGKANPNVIASAAL